MPTLDEWFDLYDDSPDILLNIDVKFPKDEKEYADELDVDLYSRNILAIIDKYDAGKKVVLETFSNTVIESLIENSSEDREFLLVQDLNSEKGKALFHEIGRISTICLTVLVPFTMLPV